MPFSSALRAPHMKKLISIFLLTGCSLNGGINVSSAAPNIQELAKLNESNNGKEVIARGYYWPSYEGSVICQTREFKNCLLVVLTNNYNKYAGKFNEGDFVAISGRFKWADIEGIEKYLKSTDEVAPLFPYHRIVQVKSIEKIRN